MGSPELPRKGTFTLLGTPLATIHESPDIHTEYTYPDKEKDIDDDLEEDDVGEPELERGEERDREGGAVGSGNAESGAAQEEADQEASTPITHTLSPDTPVIDPQSIWKLDLRIIPPLSLLFLCSFIDRSNVGNAQIVGMGKDISMSDREYTIGLGMFFLTYILSEIPSNLIIKTIRPNRWLPILALTSGLITIGMGFIRNAGSFIALRTLLGISAGGLFPGIIVYLSALYTRRQLGLRIGLVYSAASLAGAFGGLLARALSRIGADDVGDSLDDGRVRTWRCIFVVEGILTIVAAVIAYCALPNLEKLLARASGREEVDARENGSVIELGDTSAGVATATATGHHHGTIQAFVEDPTFHWPSVLRSLVSPSLWLTSFAYFSILTALYSFVVFLPSMVLEMQLSSLSPLSSSSSSSSSPQSPPPPTDPNQAQLWSVIPYAVGAVTTVVAAYCSDRMNVRGAVILCTLPFAIVGYAVLATVRWAAPTDQPDALAASSSPAPRFLMTCLMAGGLFGSVPCILAWNSNNSAGHYRRATTTAVQLAVANSGGFVAAFTYPASDAPNFIPGHTRILILLCIGWVLVLANIAYCRGTNREKMEGQYDQYLGCGDDRDPRFKMTL